MAPEMERLACPRCGSVYFLSSRAPDRFVFQVDSGRQVWLAGAHRQAAASIGISTQGICCGACSWQGQLEDLAPSFD